MNENKSDKKTIMYVGLLVACLTILSLIGTYAWYSLATSKNEEVGVEAANNLKLVYTDCNTSDVSTCADINKDLSPGDSVEKVFEVTNTSGAELSFTLYFQELLNTFKSEDLVYKLEDMTSNEVIISEKPVPYTESKLYNQVIGTDIKVPGSATNKYKLTVTFLNRDRSQNENLNAKYFLKLSIMETKSFTLSFDANGGVVDISSKQVESGKAYGELPVPTRSGYEFLGWFTESSGGTQVTNDTTVYLNNNQTLYAQWEASLPPPVVVSHYYYQVIGYYITHKSDGTINYDGINIQLKEITEGKRGEVYQANDCESSSTCFAASNYVEYNGYTYSFIPNYTSEDSKYRNSVQEIELSESNTKKNPYTLVMWFERTENEENPSS